MQNVQRRVFTELQNEGRFQDGNLKKAIISMRVARFKNHPIEAKCNRNVFRTCSIETPDRVTVWKNVDDIAVSRNERLTSTQRSSSDFHRATKRLMKLVAEICRNETFRRFFFDGTPDKSSKKFYFQNARKTCRVKSSTVSSSLLNSYRGNLYLQDVIARRHCKL